MSCQGQQGLLCWPSHSQKRWPTYTTYILILAHEFVFFYYPQVVSHHFLMFLMAATSSGMCMLHFSLDFKPLCAAMSVKSTAGLHNLHCCPLELYEPCFKNFFFFFRIQYVYFKFVSEAQLVATQWLADPLHSSEIRIESQNWPSSLVCMPQTINQ